MRISSTSHGHPRTEGDRSDDAFRVQQKDGRLIAVLADGVGSSKEGGVAARRAVDMMVDYYLSRPSAWSPHRALAEFAKQINQILYQESLIRHASPELLCTLSVVAMEGGKLYGLNVGDSPVYLFRKDTLSLLSKSHTMPGEDMRHVLTRALGLEPTVVPDAFELPIQDHDLVLLCSDGVSNALDDGILANLLRRQGAARVLVAEAVEQWEHNPEVRDDASAIVLDVVERGWEAAAGQRPLEVLGALRAGQIIDEHTLLRPMQEGERVWLASDTNGTRVVFKFPAIEALEDEGRRDGFLRELWQATRIESPDFVRAWIPAQGALRYYAMEYIEAPTLDEMLRRSPLRLEEVVQLAHFLLRTSQLLLSRDYAHGDIKPENILAVRTAERVRFVMLDLGSAAELFSVRSRAGTPSYLAPERFHDAPLSERTEVYAIGATLYRSLTRTFPYGEIERFQTPSFERQPKPVNRLNSTVPDWLAVVVARAVQADPAQRYQSFSEMLYELDNPEKVAPLHAKHAGLLERDPVLFYKTLCLLLLGLNIFLAWRLNR